MDHPAFQLVLCAGCRNISAFAALAGIQRLWPDPPWSGRCAPRVQLCFLAGDAVRCRNGHRPDVLRCRRADDALSVTARSSGLDGSSSARSDGDDLLSLGISCLGDLCHRRSRTGLLWLSLQPSVDHPLRPVSDIQRAHPWPDRTHSRRLRTGWYHFRYRHHTGVWRAPTLSRHHAPDGDRHVGRHLPHLPDCAGGRPGVNFRSQRPRQRCTSAIRIQSAASRCPAAVCAVWRSD